MSYCKEFGKDQVIFLTEEDAAKPSTVELPEPGPGEAPQGLVTESGDINWSCPCLGGMAVGPCGVEFRDAFSCFHYSEAEPKGSECFEKFVAMQECMKDFPELYDKHNQPDEGEGEEFPASVEELDSETKLELKPEESSEKAEVTKISEGVEQIDVSHEEKEEAAKIKE